MRGERIIDRRVERCLYNIDVLANYYPELSSGLYRMNPLRVSSPEVPVLAVDDRWNLYVGDKIDRYSEPEIRFVILHELFHIIRYHGERMGSRDPEIWNIACDYEINFSIDSMLCHNLDLIHSQSAYERISYKGEDKHSLLITMPKDAYHPNLSRLSMDDLLPCSAEFYYRLICDEKNDSKKFELLRHKNISSKLHNKGSQAADGIGRDYMVTDNTGGEGNKNQAKPAKSGNDKLDDKFNAEPTGMTKDESEIVTSDVNTCIESGRLAGVGDGRMAIANKRASQYLKSIEDFDWDSVINDSPDPTRNPGFDDYTMFPFSKRKYGKFLIPSMVKSQRRVCYIIDISGSMKKRDIVWAVYQVDNILSTEDVELDVCLCNSNPVFYDDVRSSEMVPLNYGGGTEMDVAVMEAENRGDYDLVMVFTDGDTPYPSINSKLENVYFLLCKPTSTPSYIKSVNLYEWIK